MGQAAAARPQFVAASFNLAANLAKAFESSAVGFNAPNQEVDDMACDKLLAA
jgi:hypothetical protein